MAAIISGSNPTGVLLFLKVAASGAKFKTRPIPGSGEGKEDCTRQLLDGQQRLTAIFRVLADNYPDRTYYIQFEHVADGGYRLSDGLSKDKKVVKSYSRYSRDNKWIGNSKEEFERQLIPMKLLHPDAADQGITWIDEQDLEDSKSVSRLSSFITEIKDGLLGEPLPYLTLSEDTALDVAIDVFMKINTSFVKLSPFDIAVALFESKAQESLQEHVDRLVDDVPRLEAVEGEGRVGDLALKVACLFQDLKPTYGNYANLNMELVDQDWGKLTGGLKWTVDILDEMKIWDQTRLPSAVPIRVLAALHQFVPMQGDDHANAMRLVRAYLWRSFTTDWYSRQANDRLFSDYKVLRDALETREYSIPKKHSDTVFQCMLPNKDDLLDEGWPTGRGILKKAILAISLQRGARDVANNAVISVKNIEDRQYHHIFPKNLFKKTGTIPRHDIGSALNCMLIDKFTNNSWKDQWPGDYLRARDIIGSAPEATLAKRLESHHLPTAPLLNATKNCGKTLKRVCGEFLKERADMTLAAIEKLCDGDTLI